jgi:hypothetical protein
MPFSPDPFYVARTARPSALVGVPAGLAAGVAYLLAQVLASLALGGMGAEPFQRISAILLGPDALPPPGEWTERAVSMAILIHLSLSAIYGRLVDAVVMRSFSMARAAALGALVGVVLFVVNRLLIAPYVFPWFDESRNLLTAINHMLFGLVAALLCITLRRYFAGRGRL